VVDKTDMYKVELHRHIEGSLRYATMKDWVLADGLASSSYENDLRDFILIEKPVDGLKVFLEKFALIHQVLSSPERIRRMAHEACEDAFNEGVRVLELRYSPIFIQGERKNLSFEIIHESILKGIAEAQEKYPMAVGLIGILGREWSFKAAEYVTDFFIAHKDTLDGMDLANDEAAFSCRPFAPLFQKAKKAGLHITVHAGESNIPSSSQSIIDAIDLLGAERLGHGVQIHKNPELMRQAADKKILLELCPSSNVLTKSVPSIDVYPIKTLLENGVRVSINADDPGVFNYTLPHEYKLLSERLGVTREEFSLMNRWAFESSFIQDNIKNPFKDFSPHSL
jgi:adenosine deaminase